MQPSEHQEESIPGAGHSADKGPKADAVWPAKGTESQDGSSLEGKGEQRERGSEMLLNENMNCAVWSSRNSRSRETPEI